MTVTRTHLVPIESIVMAPECQGRAELNAEVVREYFELYLAGVQLPPIEVFDVQGTPYLVDGFHRHDAACASGLVEIEAVFVGRGTFDEAVWYSTGVNKNHGLRRSNADKRRAVRNALLNPIGQEQSSRTIAKHVGVSHTMVNDVRAEVEGRRVEDSSTRGTLAEMEDSSTRGTLAEMEDSSTSTGGDMEDSSTSPRDRRVEESSTLEGDDRRQARPPAPSEPDVEQLGVLAQQLADASRDEEEADGVLRGARRSLMRIVDRGGLLAHHIRGVADALLDHSRKLPQHTPVLHPECGGDGCRACDRRGYVLRMTAEGRR